jgi:predicted metal-dependent phosphoesterase TrpH
MDLPLKQYRADLHIHTALSPCASEEMTPPAIVQAALGAGLDMIAVTDHNAAGNIAAVQRAADAAGGSLTVLPGMEITSVEEVHVLGLFPDLRAAESVAGLLRTLLPPADADYYVFFGEQPLLAADGREVGAETAALSAAAPLDLTETVELIHSFGGVAVAAHVDRRAFSVFSQLGFFPKDAGFDGVEVSRHLGSGSPRMREFAALGLPVTSSSDSHFLAEIGTAGTDLRIAEPTFAELALALAGADDRSVARA